MKELKGNRKKPQTEVQENTNKKITQWNKEEIQDCKSEFNKEIQILKKTQAEMKMELKNSITQLETQSNLDHVEDNPDLKTK